VSPDADVLEWAVAVREPWLTSLMTGITHTGGVGATIVLALIAAVLLMRAGRTGDATLVGGAVLTGWPVMSLLKNLFGRTRPPEPERLIVIQTESFPSGHAMMTAILATVLAVVVVRTWPRRDRRRIAAFTVLATYSLVVGLSRIYLAAHWTTDVVAGWICGVAWALLWVWFLTRVRPAR
jgi:undecaprenyl-diphosphatase